MTSILPRRSRLTACGIALTAAVCALAPATANADTGLHHFKVTITNLTKGQPLSPPVLVTNYGKGEIFKPGAKANWGVEQIAENGNTDPLYAGLMDDQKNGYVTGLVRSDAGPVVPVGSPAAAKFASSVTLTIAAKQGQNISWISMLGCTNDGFAGFNAARLPRKVGRSVNVPVTAYDAGTEENTEDFEDLVGGCQGAIGVMSQFGATGTNMTNWELAENGVIHQHEGIFGASDDGLLPEVHGWTGPVAKVRITEID